jgi:hypothetical protein
VQELTTRLRGRVEAAETTFASAADLASALHRAAVAHGGKIAGFVQALGELTGPRCAEVGCIRLLQSVQAHNLRRRLTLAQKASFQWLGSRTPTKLIYYPRGPAEVLNSHDCRRLREWPLED